MRKELKFESRSMLKAVERNAQSLVCRIDKNAQHFCVIGSGGKQGTEVGGIRGISVKFYF